MLKLNSIPSFVFEASDIVSDSKVKVNGGDISRKSIIATGRMLACEYVGKNINLRPDMKNAYVSKFNGENGADYASVSRKHMDKKLLFCASIANKLSGKDAPASVEEVKNNASYARDPFFLRTLAEIDKEVLDPIFFSVLDSVGMGLMQWDSAPMGRTTEIEIRSNDVFLFEDGSFGSGRSTSKNYLYAKTITLTPKVYTCNATIKWYQDIVNGDAGRYYAAIMNGMWNKIYAIMLGNMKTLVSNPAYVPAGLTASTYSTQNWIALCNKVAAANGIRRDNLMAIGGTAALSAILPVDGTGAAILGLQYGLGEEWFKQGYLPNAAGVSLFEVTPAIVPGTQNNQLLTIDTGNNIYITAKAGAGYAPMRGVYAEGNPITLTATPSETADFTIDINCGALFEIAPLFASKIGVITNVTGA